MARQVNPATILSSAYRICLPTLPPRPGMRRHPSDPEGPRRVPYRFKAMVWLDRVERPGSWAIYYEDDTDRTIFCITDHVVAMEFKLRFC